MAAIQTVPQTVPTDQSANFSLNGPPSAVSPSTEEPLANIVALRQCLERLGTELRAAEDALQTAEPFRSSRISDRRASQGPDAPRGTRRHFSKLVRSKEAANYLGISPWTLRQLVHLGEIEYI